MTEEERKARVKNLVKYNLKEQLAEMLVEAWDEEDKMFEGLNKVLDEAGIEFGHKLDVTYEKAFRQLLEERNDAINSDNTVS